MMKQRKRCISGTPEDVKKKKEPRPEENSYQLLSDEETLKTRIASNGGSTKSQGGNSNPVSRSLVHCVSKKISNVESNFVKLNKTKSNGVTPEKPKHNDESKSIRINHDSSEIMKNVGKNASHPDPRGSVVNDASHSIARGSVAKNASHYGPRGSAIRNASHFDPRGSVIKNASHLDPRGSPSSKIASHGASITVMPVGGYVSKGAKKMIEFKNKLDLDNPETVENAYFVDSVSDNDSYDDFEDAKNINEFIRVEKKSRKRHQRSESNSVDMSSNLTRNFTFFLLENKRINPFAVRSELQAILRRENILIGGGRGTIVVKNIDEEEATALFAVKDLDGYLVRAKPPTPTNPTTRVVILGVDPSISTESIIEHSGCLAAYRITRREGSEIKSTTAVILDYPQSNVPTFVHLLFLRFKTRPYNRPPVRCFRCQQFGHVAKHCSRPDKCGKCLGDHDSRECPSPSGAEKICASCNGDDHSTGGAGCPRRQRAQAINTTMAREGTTYAQAARSVRGAQVQATQAKPAIPIVKGPAQPESSTPTPAPQDGSVLPAASNQDDKIQTIERKNQQATHKKHQKKTYATERQTRGVQPHIQAGEKVKETQKPDGDGDLNSGILMGLVALIETLMAQTQSCTCNRANNQPDAIQAQSRNTDPTSADKLLKAVKVMVSQAMLKSTNHDQ